jgi:hypothetical protein
MTNLVDYRVAREHQGDLITDEGTRVHRFQEGDTRTANPTTVATLVKQGVLVDPDAKAEPALENKAEGDSPKDKAEKPASGQTKGK